MLVTSHIHESVGYLTLNRPEKRNALNPELVKALDDALEVFAQNPQVKVVVLAATGKAFCAGADLEYIQQLQHFSFEQNLADSARLRHLFERMYAYPKPLIAKVQGHALAGGCGLATLCDVVFSVPDALFGYTEVRIGFIPALVMVFLLRKIGESKARELLLSGEPVHAYKAKEMGLVHHVEEADQLDAVVTRYTTMLVENNSSQAMQLTREMIRQVGDMQLSEALDFASRQNAHARSTEDCKKGIASFLGKSKPSW